MISVNGTEFSFCNGGFFTTDSRWIHPSVCQETHQLIYVTEGTVSLSEEGTAFELTKGNVLLLAANRQHFGSRPSVGRTSFYWMHFYCSDLEKLELPRLLTQFDEGAIFKELLHYSCLPNCDPFLTDAVCLYLLAKIRDSAAALAVGQTKQSKIVHEIYEWTRINADAKLTVAVVAAHFGYSADHISRMMHKYYKTGLKSILDGFVIKRANALLCNTNFSTKEIAAMLNFPDADAFFKFYKYHEALSPSQFRNRYTHTHMNAS